MSLTSILSPQEVDALRRILGVYHKERDMLAERIAAIQGEVTSLGAAPGGASVKELDELTRRLLVLEAEIAKQKEQAAAKVQRLTNRIMTLDKRLSALEAGERPPRGDPWPEEDDDDDDKPLEEFYNECLVNSSRIRRFRDKYKPRAVKVDRRDGTVVLVESRATNLLLVQHSDEWMLVPEFAATHFDRPDLQDCFELNREAVDEESSGYVVRLDKAARPKAIAGGWSLNEGEKGVLAVSRGD
jgi:hypothetical protein